MRDRIARSLPYGIQRRVEIARAISAQPKLLLLDEPVAGMNHDEADDIRRLMLTLRDSGLSILLIEHDMAFVMNLCDYLYVLDFGVMIAQGRPEQIRTQSGRFWMLISDTPRDASDPQSCMSATEPSPRCAASTSTSRRARSSRWSAPTAPARRTVARAIAGLLPYQGEIRYAGRRAQAK